MTKLHAGVWVRGALLAGATLIAASCGGGGGGGSNEAQPIAEAAGNFFPLDTNSRWVYSSSAGPQPVVSEVTGVRSTAAGPGVVVRTVDPTQGADDEAIYVSDAAGVREYAPAGSDALGRALDGVALLRWPAYVGDTFVQVDTTFDSGIDFDGDGRSDRVALFLQSTVVASEPVQTPAGRFEGCLHQQQQLRQTILPSSGAPPAVYNGTIDVWFAPGVGVVKSVTRIRGLGLDQTTTETLLAYRVGTRTSDAVAPTVVSVTPGTAPVRGLGAVVSAVFSEVMDAASFELGSFGVVDAAGQPVVGTVEVEGVTARFVLGQALASGSYTARIAGTVRDAIGNPMGSARSWAFVVDASAPGVVASSPAPDADDVALDATLVLRFGEPLAVASVNSTTVVLSAAGLGPVPALLSVQGHELRIAPTGGLQRATRYEVVVQGVTDAVGNPMAQGHRLQFRTTQGRFAYPKPLLEGVTVEAVAIADVDGDGINDVVFTTGFSFPNKPALYVRAGRADGSLAPAAAIDIGTQLTCFLDSVVVGDLNGDRRPDIAVGGNFCGVQVLHRSATGSWVIGPFLGHAASGKLRIADIDSDGRLDLVGVGGGVASVAVWRQTATGALVLHAEPGTGSSFGRDIEVGDLNGDGRADLVVAAQGTVGTDISVLLQRPDGSFSAPFFLDTQSVWGATGLALGDLNGDGRIDIAASTGGNSPTHVAVFFQAAGGTFGPVTKIATYDIPNAVRVTDIDGDGRMDLVVSHRAFARVGIYLQQPSGVLAEELRFAADTNTVNVHSMAVGDINRDGRPDIVAEGGMLLQQPQAAGTVAQAPKAGRSMVRAAAKTPYR